jgi:hypothetical protein
MKTSTLMEKFSKMGARVNVRPLESPVRVSMNRGARYSVDVRTDADGEHFDFRLGSGVEMQVADLRPKDRHLLLLVKSPGDRESVVVPYLCGHDERHWFIAPVPGRPTTVIQAKEQLKPGEAISSQQRAGLKLKKAQKRRNRAFVRQGEWFFIPMPADFKVNESLILKNERLQRATRRGFNKPHMAQELCRQGGQTVMVCRQYPQGLNDSEYKKVIRDNPEAKDYSWQPMRLNPTVYVRGRITHPDHKTLRLSGWHKVLMNRENETPVGEEMRFLD